MQDTTEVKSMITAEQLSATGNYQRKLIQAPQVNTGLSTLANIGRCGTQATLTIIERLP